ncbi:UNVERIFIED_CONTAM: hypothetical protein GTU68_016369 [Idotea baltica]|nr:hypothetical protein [Idotea baltica]
MTKKISHALTFDDVLLKPAYSEVLPKNTELKTVLAGDIALNIPLISAAMDTVTESRLAIAIAQEGGLGIVHKNMTPEQQALEVKRVKKSESGMIMDPITIGPNERLLDVIKIMEEYSVSGLPVTTPDAKDKHGRLRVGAALGVSADFEERLEALEAADVDILTVDSAHGHSGGVLECVKRIKALHPNLPLIAGNIATASGAKALADAGADAVKVGIGPGSICTTRIVSGCGMPQITAVMEASEALKGSGVRVISDGGIKFSGDIVKAIAAGADSVMIGSLFAGTEEAPGETVLYKGRSYKLYRGMGSLGAMEKGSKDRYFQAGESDQSKLVPEGIEGRVPYKGSVSSSIYQLVGGIRAGMGYCGVQTIPDLQDKSEFIRITAAGLGESHVHDVFITKEAPNYSVN